VAGTGKPLAVADVHQEPRYFHVPEIPDTRAELAVPLRTKDRVIGVLDIQSRRLDPFDQSDLIVLQSLADQAAIAIENSRLYEQARQLAALEERQRLARDLHDSVTQALYGMTLYSRAAVGQLSLGQVDKATKHLQEMQRTAQEALAEMRLLVYELRPPILAEEGMVAALRARLKAVEARAGLKTSLQADETIQLPPATEEALYLIAREALNNALKHAHARTVTVLLRRADDAVQLEIIDDGRGFDPIAARSRGGLGIVAMEERARELGAELELKSRPGEGSLVRVEVVS
jgi:signal transduction histidine kinase